MSLRIPFPADVEILEVSEIVDDEYSTTGKSAIVVIQLQNEYQFKRIRVPYSGEVDKVAKAKNYNKITVNDELKP